MFRESHVVSSQMLRETWKKFVLAKSAQNISEMSRKIFSNHKVMYDTKMERFNNINTSITRGDALTFNPLSSRPSLGDVEASQ